MLLGGLLASPAVADEKPRRVGLVLEPARKADADKVGQLTSLIVAAFEKRKFVRARMVAPLHPTSLEDGRRLAEEARKALASDHNMQRYKDHEGVLTRALLGLKGGLGAATPRELADVYRGLASTRLADGDRRLAEGYMTTVINLNPALEERDFFGRGALKDLFRDVKGTAHLRKSTAIRVESTPRGAEVFVGDKLAGYTPLKVEGLKEGTHLIRVRADGFYSHGWLVDSQPGSPLTLSHRLRPIAGRAKFEQLTKTLNDARAWKRKADQMPEAATILKRLLRADDLVVAKVKRTKTGYKLTGAVSPRGKPPVRLDLDIPLDSNLLKRVDVLTFEWAP